MEAQDAITGIQAARVRCAMRRAKVAEVNRKDAEELRRQVLDELAGQQWPAWMLEYVGEVRGGESFRFALHLPGCAPISVHMFPNGRVRNYVVLEPERVEYRAGEGWRVAGAERLMFDLDEAIDLAAGCGESWFEMQADADRRSADGLKPPAPPPTAWEAAQEALKIFRQLRANPVMTDQAIAALSLVVIAEQLNLLNDTLLETDR